MLTIKNIAMRVGLFIAFMLAAAYAAAPGAFFLNSPSHGASNVDLKPAFSWGTAFGAYSYKVQVSRTSDFSCCWEVQGFNITATT